MNEATERWLKDQLGTEWNFIIDNKPTFAYVLFNCWDEVSNRWHADGTLDQYTNHYHDYVLPALNDKALVDCTREDFDNVMKHISEQRKEENLVYNNAQERHYRYIIKRVLEAADESGICPDFLWGTEYAFPDKGEEADLIEKEYVRLRKSFSIQEELMIYDRIMTDPEQPAVNFGLALMFCLGLRNNEACGADFGDIRPFDCDPEFSALWVHKSTEKGSNVQRHSGKTSNSPRIIPLPSKLKALLQRRRELLEERLGVSVEALPIVGLGDSFDERCSAPILTKAGTQLLKGVKLDQEMLALIDRDLRAPGRTEEGFIEKDATAYLFRRNLGTHLYLLGLESSEIEYIIGHNIEDDNDERNYFRNEELLYPIAKKMALRPIVNDPTHKEVTVSDKPLEEQDVHQARLILPSPAQYKLTLRQQEPFSRLRVSLKQSDSDDTTNIKGTVVTAVHHDDYKDGLLITKEYQKKYSKEIDDAVRLHRMSPV